MSPGQNGTIRANTSRSRRGIPTTMSRMTERSSRGPGRSGPWQAPRRREVERMSQIRDRGFFESRLALSLTLVTLLAGLARAEDWRREVEALRSGDVAAREDAVLDNLER